MYQVKQAKVGETMKHKKIITIMLVSLLISSQALMGITALAENRTIETQTEANINEQAESQDEKKATIESDDTVFVVEDLTADESLATEEKVTEEDIVALEEQIAPKKLEADTRETGIRVESKGVRSYPLGAPKETRERIIHQNSDVYINGKKATRDEYDLVYYGTDDYDYLGNTNLTESMRFVDKKSGDSAFQDNYVYTGVYGDSLVFESHDNRNLAGAFTIHTDAPQWTITGTAATGKPSRGQVSPDLVNKNYPGQDYFKIELLRPKPGVPAFDSSTEVVKSLTAKGDDRKVDVLNQWKSVKVEPGDVVRTWSIDGAKNNNRYVQKTYYDREQKSNDTADYAEYGDGVAYYSVFKSGYRPYEFKMPEDEPRLQTKTRTVVEGTTKDELDAGIEYSFVEVPEFATIKGFEKYPDTSVPGSSNGKVKVEEESLYIPGKINTYIYDAPFRVLDDEVVDPEGDLDIHFISEPSLPIGTRVEEVDAASFIDYVSYKGQVLDESEYKLKLDTTKFDGDDNPFFEVLEKEEDQLNLKIDATLTKDSKVTTSENVMVWLKMNHSIFAKGRVEWILSSVSLLETKDKKPYMRANGAYRYKGHKPWDNITNGDGASKVSVFRNSNEKENELLQLSHEALGKTSTEDVAKEWNKKIDEYNKDIRYGDVLSQAVYDGSMKSLDGVNRMASRTERGRESAVEETRYPNANTGYGYEHAYYELTPNGYRLLHLNEITFRTPKFKDDMSKEEINGLVAESAIYHAGITNPKEYANQVRYQVKDVDTKTVGVKKGTVEIYEQLENGQEFMVKQEFTYEVVPSLKIDLKPVTVPVGTKPELIDANDYIESVYFGDKKLSPSEYTATIDNKVDTMKVTESGTIIQVKMKDKEESRGGVVNTNVVWGDSVVSKREDETIGTSISLLHDKNAPYLKANEGTGFLPDAKLQLRPFTYVYRDSTENSLLADNESGYAGVSTPMIDTMNKWNTAFDSKTFKYGDVLGFRVNKNSPDVSYMGANTWISRDEKLVKETEGYDMALYEMTKTGYRLMGVNQLSDDNKGMTVNLPLGASKEQINSDVAGKIDFKGKDQSKFSFEASDDIDTSKVGTRTGTINVYENLSSGGKFMTTMPITYKVEQGYNVEFKDITIPVGTPIEDINANDYVKSVSEAEGGKAIDPKNYEVKIDTAINTMKVSTQDTKVTVNINGQKVSDTRKTNVAWGHSIVTKVDDKADAKIDASVSMIDKNGKPYLVANEGTGFGTGKLYNRPFIGVLRNSTEETIFEAGYHSNNSPAKDTMNKWNNGDDKTEALSSKEYQYGDVFRYRVTKNVSTNDSEMGNKTWASRDEKLVKETVGYDMAYYEMTKDGFRLMHFNQLQANDKIPVVKLNETLADMNKKASEAVLIPNHIKDPERFRFEYVSVDTETSGVKTSKMNVYEKLSTGKEFKTTIDVKYQVNPQVKEMFYDQKGNRIQVSRITDFDLGGSYQPVPDNFISSGADVYIYKGWLNGSERPGIDTPREGQPEKATKETVIHYIYEKADNYINMTVPTEMVFGTEINGKDITSKDYAIKNNSKEVATEVSLKEFKKESSEVKLLTQKDSDPKKEDKSARLNLMMNGSESINSLSDSSKNETIATMLPGEQGLMNMGGKYFGSKSESAKVKYHMQLQFKAKGN